MKKQLLLIVLVVISLSASAQKAEIGVSGLLNVVLATGDEETLGEYNEETLVAPNLGLHFSIPLRDNFYLRSELGYQMMTKVAEEKYYHLDHNTNNITYSFSHRIVYSDYLYITLLPEFRFGKYFAINMGPAVLKRIGGEYHTFDLGMDLALRGSFIIRGNINNLGVFAEFGYMRTFDMAVLDDRRFIEHEIFFVPNIGFSYQL